MRAVWSFWSKPFKAYKGRVWQHPQHHLMAWGLSLSLARQHVDETMLVTDTEGKALLVDRLGLHFDLVSTALDDLSQADPGWWALGKLAAYSLQDRPFVHLDTDVFLWKPLPPSLLSAPVFAQCPEQHAHATAWCGPQLIEQLFERHSQALPAEWLWASSRNPTSFREENCGILGGTHFNFLRYYSTLAINLVTDPALQTLWAELPEKSGFNMVLEQFLLAACIDYHRIHPTSPFRGLDIRYLFPTWGEAFNEQATARAGFTHLLGDAKTNPDVMARLERRVALLDPALHRHCQRIAL